ncbi:hypothetical protein [Shimia sp. MIT1388]|uniref:hypothetical protein n=1 Tax=Shimia sp. MIT1388 TaxID=3096992 RepID=UPI00399AC786
MGSEWEYVYFSQSIASVLKASNLSWDEFWPELKAAAQAGESTEVLTNAIDFAFDAETRKFKVAVEFGAKETVWLTEKEFAQEVPKYVKGGPKSDD